MTREEFRDLIDSLERTPAAVRERVESFGEDRWKKVPEGEPWGAVHQVCHLRDIEREGHAVRIGRLLAEDKPFLPGIDGEQLAIDRDYASQDLRSALEAFAGARAETVLRLRALTPEHLARAGTLDGIGAITLEKLLLMAREHDQEHLTQMKALLEKLVSERR